MLDCEFQHDNRQSRTLEIAKEFISKYFFTTTTTMDQKTSNIIQVGVTLNS